MSESNVYQTPTAELRREPSTVAMQLRDPQSRPAGAGLSWISQSWSVFKRQPGLWVGMILVYMAIGIVLSMIPLVSILLSLIAPVFTAGFMIAAYNTDVGGNAQFGDMFGGFKQKTGTLIVVALLQFVLSIVVLLLVGGILFAIIGMEGVTQLAEASAGDPEYVPDIIMPFMLAGLLYMALIIPIVMMIWFSPVLIIRHDLGAWEAMMTSFKGCLRNILPFLVYGIGLIPLSIAAAIPLFLGFLVLIPVITISIYVGYKDIYLEST